MIKRLLLFGATGGLVGRFLLPALAELYDEGRLPDGFRVVGAARQDWDDETFQRHVAQRLDRQAACDVSAARCATGRSTSTTGQASPRPWRTPAASLRPAGFAPAVEALDAVGLPQGSRIVLEKPFGDDPESGVKLDRLLRHGGRDCGAADGVRGSCGAAPTSSR
jgi:glucose-6-phosphate 1-dehydrogenase